MTPEQIRQQAMEQAPHTEESLLYQDFKKEVSSPKTVKVGLYQIAKYLIAKFHIKTLGDNHTREIYFYNGGYYDRRGASVIKNEIEKILEELTTAHYKNEIVEKVKDMTYCQRADFVIDKDLLNFKNCILNVRTREAIKHSPDYLFLSQIPVVYDPTVQMEHIPGFLAELLGEKDIEIFYEWLAFALYRQYFIKKALILFGERNTGKTTLLNLITRFTGTDNICGVSLQKIASDKFAIAHLYEKHLNIYDDLSFDDINDNGAFKMATGGGYITGEYKFGEQFIFESFAKLVFSCNKIPSSKDIDDDAYFSRWILIKFERQLDREKMDSQILNKIITEKEMSGLLNKALSKLNTLLSEQEFSYQKEVHEIKSEMLQSSSSLAGFVFNVLERGTSEDWVEKEAMYQYYADYAQDGELGVETKDKFGKNLTKYAGYIVDSKKYNNLTEKSERGWRNVRVRTATTPTTTEMTPFVQEDGEVLPF